MLTVKKNYLPSHNCVTVVIVC